MSRFASFIVLIIIQFYRSTLSYFFGGNCRYYPSCSVYAKECFETHDFSSASLLTVKRLCSCHPFTSKRQLFDPVPVGTKKNNKNT